MRKEIVIRHPIIWSIIASLFCVSWSILFWYIFFDRFSWNILHIPIGLGGALYFVFFVPPVLIGSILYELILSYFLRKKNTSFKMYLLLSLWIPFGIIAILLIIFCPMDTESSYLGYIIKELIFKISN